MEQEQRRSLKRGYEFNCMVVGEAGLGKTTLVNTLFRSPVARRCPPPSWRLVECEKVQAKHDEVDARHEVARGSIGI